MTSLTRLLGTLRYSGMRFTVEGERLVVTGTPGVCWRHSSARHLTDKGATMHPSRFDQFARSVAAPRSRRSLLRAVSGAAVGLLGFGGATPIVFAAVHRAAGLSSVVRGDSEVYRPHGSLRSPKRKVRRALCGGDAGRASPAARDAHRSAVAPFRLHRWLNGWSLLTRKASVMSQRRCARAAGDVAVHGRALALPSVGVA